MNRILEYLVIILIVFPISFLASWGIVEGWVLFWDYGWIWNETTVPPMVIWDILFTNISMVLIIACIITPIAFIILVYFINNM